MILSGSAVQVKGLGSSLVSARKRDPTNPNLADTFVQEPSMHAFDALTGSILWEANKNQSFGPTTLAGRVIFSGFTGLSANDLPAIKGHAFHGWVPGERA